MGKHRQTKNTAEKLEIIQYSNSKSVLQAPREFNVSTTSIYKWKELYELKGESGLGGNSERVDLTQEMKHFRLFFLVYNESDSLGVGQL